MSGPGNIQEFLETDLTEWVIGPYHGSLPGAMRLKLLLDGEIVVRAEVETGFLHRGLEKALELHPWNAAISYVDRLDPECATFGELAFCLAVEQIAEIQVPPRARLIRVILSELTRISAHLAYIARLARAVGSETMVHYVLRERERVLDLFELLTGARFSLNFLRFGGVKADVTDGFIERVLEVCDHIRIRFKEYNDLFSYNHALLKRTASVGVIQAAQAKEFGLTGPNARAAGHPFDIRKAHPYSMYDSLDFKIPVGSGEAGMQGDAQDRFLLRLREITQSLDILKEASDQLPRGEHNAFQTKEDEPIPQPPIPAGEAYSRIESPRGLLGCHVVADGSDRPARVQFRTPSSASIQILPVILEGMRIEDLPVVLASLDIGVAEADR